MLPTVDKAAPYRVEAQHADPAWSAYTDPDGWIVITAGSRHYCRGYIDSRREAHHRVAHRIRHVKRDRVVEELPALLDAPIWPSQRQQIDAAIRVLERAAQPWREGDPELTALAEAGLAALRAGGGR